MDGELTAAQSDALLTGGPGDRDVLTAFLHERFEEWPWWNRAWRIVEIRAVRVWEINAHWLHTVTIDGTVGPDVTVPLAVFARVSARKRIDRFEVRVGEMLIGPPSREDETHPFGVVFSALMDRRGISLAQMSRRLHRAQSTVSRMRAGLVVPRQPEFLAEVAAALGMPVGDLEAVVGLPADD